jgi:hypothetical protein
MLRTTASDTRKKNLFMVTGLGIFLYLLSVNRSPVIYMSDIIFPPSQITPYGIVTVSLFAPFAYMINILHVEDLPFNNKVAKNNISKPNIKSIYNQDQVGDLRDKADTSRI